MWETGSEWAQPAAFTRPSRPAWSAQEHIDQHTPQFGWVRQRGRPARPPCPRAGREVGPDRTALAPLRCTVRPAWHTDPVVLGPHLWVVLHDVVGQRCGKADPAQVGDEQLCGHCRQPGRRMGMSVVMRQAVQAGPEERAAGPGRQRSQGILAKHRAWQHSKNCIAAQRARRCRYGTCSPGWVGGNRTWEPSKQPIERMNKGGRRAGSRVSTLLNS